MELHDLTALEQARAIRRREVSSVELARHYLARAHSLNEAVGAFVTITDDLALSQAAEADRLVRESPEVERLPVLHGVVVPVKDLNQVRGVRTRFGSLTVDVVSSVDDDVVAELRRGNTVMTGKTTTPEFGLPGVHGERHRPLRADSVGPHPRRRRVERRSRGGGGGGPRARGPGLRRRRVHPHPGQRLRPRRASSPRAASSPTGRCPTGSAASASRERSRGRSRTRPRCSA